MNYTELVQQIKDYVENPEEPTFLANIPNFVRKAEEDIVRDLKIPLENGVQTGVLTSGSRTIEMPTNFVRELAFSVVSGGRYSALNPKQLDFMRVAYPSTTVTGLPRYYSFQDQGTMVVAPTPNSAYAFELLYLKKPTSIVDAFTTWIGDNAESALLYGSLRHAYTFMLGDADIMKVYFDLYNEAVGKLKVKAEAGVPPDMYRVDSTSGGT